MTELALLLLLLFAALVLLALVLLLLLRDLWRGLGPAILYARGRFAEAAALGARPFWQKKVFRSVRLASDYNQAACLHMQGHLDQSLRMLRAIPIDGLDRNLRGAVEGVLGGTLVLLDRDPDEAIALLERARQIQDAPGLLLLIAHAELSRGDEAAADRFFRAASGAGGEALKLGVKSVLFRVKSLDEVSDAYLRGWYLVRAGRAADARPDLERAATSRFDSVYRQRALVLLESAGPSSA